MASAPSPRSDLRSNQVHRAIAKTIRENSDRFSQLNSGFLVGASKIIIDDNKKTATLRNASVNNGSQSQGEIRMYFDECKNNGAEPINFAIRCELSVDPDSSSRTHIAVARNTTTKIEGISKDASEKAHARSFLSLDNQKERFAQHAPRHGESFPGQPCRKRGRERWGTAVRNGWQRGHNPNAICPAHKRGRGRCGNAALNNDDLYAPTISQMCECRRARVRA
jgi:hypothetical protein